MVAFGNSRQGVLVLERVQLPGGSELAKYLVI